MLWPATCSACPAPQGASAGHSMTAQFSGTLQIAARCTPEAETSKARTELQAVTAAPPSAGVPEAFRHVPS